MIAISTAYKKALIAIDIDGERATAELDSNCKHSENIMPKLDELLNNMGKSLKDNDSYCTVIGPGSFTGLRISISLLKGFLAADKDKKIVAITTNELMAYSYVKNFSPKKDFVTVIDGLSGNYFVSQFDKNGIKIDKEHIVVNEISEFDLDSVGLEEESLDVTYKVNPTSEELLELAQIKLKNGETISESNLIPLYLRKSQAEAQLDDNKNEKVIKNLKNQ